MWDKTTNTLFSCFPFLCFDSFCCFFLFRTWIRHISHLWRWLWAVECLRWHCCCSSSSMCQCGGEIKEPALETKTTGWWLMQRESLTNRKWQEHIILSMLLRASKNQSKHTVLSVYWPAGQPRSQTFSSGRKSSPEISHSHFKSLRLHVQLTTLMFWTVIHFLI